MQTLATARSRRAAWPSRSWSAIVATAFALFVAECSLRVWQVRTNRSTLEQAWSAARTLAPGDKARLVDLIRPSLDDRVIYELRPSLRDVEFKGARVDTNRHGFRTRELDETAPPNTVTILGLGDSLMFGHGVGNDETYLAELEQRLDARRADRSWRTVNTAAPGYNTVMEVALLRARGLAFQPDIVVLGVCANDYAPPEYVRLAEDPWRFDKSYVLDLVTGAARRVHAAHSDTTLVHKSEWGAEFADLPGRVPPRYRATVGVEAFERALDELRGLADQHRFRVLVFTTYEYRFTEDMLAAARERGFPTVSLMDELLAVLHREGAKGFDEDSYRRSSLVVSPSNGHPSALQHRMAAERLYRELDALGWLDDPWLR